MSHRLLILVALFVVVATLLFMRLPVPPTYAGRIIENAGHLPVFFLVTLGLLIVLRNDFKVHGVRLYVYGGLLGAGSDPCCLTEIAGYGDQRNFELLVEAGFTPVEAVQIMTLNGARILGIADRVGSIAPGKQADLVVLDGDPVAHPSDIRKVALVFRQGVGYDPVALTTSIHGMVGLK